MEDTWPQIMTELNALNAASIQKHRGKLENSIHQSLEPSEDKDKQTRQLNVIAEISRMSMEVVQRELEKNMHTFDQYVRLNVLAVPPELRDDVAAIRVREKKKHDQTNAQLAKRRARDDATAHLVTTQREVDERLRELQQIDRRITELQLEAQALARTDANVDAITTAQDHILQLPTSVVAPVQRTAAEVALLTTQTDALEAMHATLDADVRAFDRTKADDRGTLLNLQTRFLTRMRASPSLTEFADALAAKRVRK